MHSSQDPSMGMRNDPRNPAPPASWQPPPNYPYPMPHYGQPPQGHYPPPQGHPYSPYSHPAPPSGAYAPPTAGGDYYRQAQPVRPAYGGSYNDRRDNRYVKQENRFV